MKKTLFLFVLFALTLSACTVNGYPISVVNERVNGSGKIITETRYVSGFNKVDLQGIGNLTIVQGSDELLTITSDDNFMDYITTEVVNGTLEIGMKPNLSLNPTGTIDYKLTVKSLSSVVLSGFGSITAGKLTRNELEVRLAGSGEINLGMLESDTLLLRVSGFGDINVENMNVKQPNLEITGSGDINVDQMDVEDLAVKISGFGNADLTGKAETQEVQILGSGNYRAGNLESERAIVKITGFGDAKVWAKSDLDVTITGSGNLDYYGSPRVTQSVTSFGKINSLGEH